MVTLLRPVTGKAGRVLPLTAAILPEQPKPDMSIDSTRARINGLTKALSASWGDAKHSWRDAKCRQFEERYLDELFASVDSAGTVIEKLERTIKQMRKDCE